MHPFIPLQAPCAMKAELTARKPIRAVQKQHMKVRVQVQRRAEAPDQGDRTGSCTRYNRVSGLSGLFEVLLNPGQQVFVITSPPFKRTHDKPVAILCRNHKFPAIRAKKYIASKKSRPFIAIDKSVDADE